MTIHLRPYQEQALQAEARHRAEHPEETRLAIVMATGLGKTIVMAERARRHFADINPSEEPYPGRVLFLVHTDELAGQAEAKIRLVIGDAWSVGVVKAERDETNADVIIGSVQTLANPARRAQITDVGLVIVDECFPAGTLVGGKRIESLKPGDVVPSWDERTGTVTSRPVVAIMKKRPSATVRVTLDDGQDFACTPNHPILTDSGWCPAGGLWRGASVVSFTHDSDARSELYGVREARDSDTEGPDRHLSQDRPDVLPRSLSGHVGGPERFGANDEDQSQVRLGAHEGAQPDASAGEPSEDGRHPEGDRAQAELAWRKWETSPGAASQVGSPSRLAHRGHMRAEGRGTPVSLPGGHRASDDEGSDRGGRGIPFLAGSPSLRPSQSGTPVFARVVAVQVLEPGSDGTYGGVCPDGFVYNIEVADTHTYLIGDGVVVHNCHHAVADSYQAIMRHFGCFGAPYLGHDEHEPEHTPALGFTATLERGDGRGLGEIWQNVAFTRDISWAVRHGWLVQPVGHRLEIPDDRLSRFAAPEVQDQALVDAFAPEKIVEEWIRLAKDRPTVAFMPLVRSARALTAAFEARGVETRTVHGDLPEKIRRDALRAYEDGKVQVLVNAMVLTEGWDSPRTKCVIVGRPTKSRSLFVQMAGRGLRPVPGIPVEDQECILLCVADSTTDLCSVADLSDKPLDRKATGALTAMEDQWDIGKHLEDQARHWTGRVDVRDFDPLVTRSSKVWRRTRGGTYFLPISKDREFVFIVGTSVYAYVRDIPTTRMKASLLHAGLPDLELALSVAEDEAQERGGDLGKLLADRDRPWRRERPSEAMLGVADRLGLSGEVARIMASKAAGKAGKVSDLISMVIASRALDPMVERIRKAAS